MTRSLLTVSLLFYWLVSVAPCAAAQEDSPPPYPDPLRFKDAIEAFETQDRADPPPPGAVLCIGSSSMRFWHDTLADDLQPVTLIGRGFGGSTMLDVLYFSSRVVVPYRPRAILLYEGDNDVDFGVSAARIMATFDQFMEVVRASLPETRLYLLAIKPSPARWDSWPVMKKANELLQQACADDPLMEYIDIASPMLGPDGLPLAEIFLEDKLHMNRRGYEIWTREVRRVMVEREAALE